VWPKVIWDGSRDTVIEVANTGNPMVHALCFYINAAPVNPNLPPSATNPPQWVETDFEIWLTKQQPTHWVASNGRQTNGFDEFGSDGSGWDPGLVPPVPAGFQGELKCVQVDDAGAPMPGNKLVGKATLRDDDGDVSSYNAIAILGNPALSGSQIGTDLALNLTATNTGGEYNACPDTLILNHFADGVSDPVIEQLGNCSAGNCPISTTLTLVPCQEDIENQIPGKVNVSFQIFNEFEQPLSTTTTVDCWLNAPLNTIGAAGANSPFTFNVLGTVGAHTRITPVPGAGGVIGVAEETRRDSNTEGPGTRAAFNLDFEGNRYDAATDGKGNKVAGVTDHIVIPPQ